MPTNKFQVDVGSGHWAKASIDVIGANAPFRLLDWLVTNKAGGGFKRHQEYCRGNADAAKHLADAKTLRLRHAGEFKWAVYPAAWNLDSSPNRVGAFQTMPAHVTFAAVKNDEDLPKEMFEGTVRVGDKELTLRFWLEMVGGYVKTIAWYHNGDEDVRYLLPVDADIPLKLGTASWTGESWRRWVGTPEIPRVTSTPLLAHSAAAIHWVTIFAYDGDDRDQVFARALLVGTDLSPQELSGSGLRAGMQYWYGAVNAERVWQQAHSVVLQAQFAQPIEPIEQLHPDSTIPLAPQPGAVELQVVAPPSGVAATVAVGNGHEVRLQPVFSKGQLAELCWYQNTDVDLGSLVAPQLPGQSGSDAQHDATLTKRSDLRWTLGENWAKAGRSLSWCRHMPR